ncbi:hypothetical protein AK812_SmicGene18157 [Symbiodinium microadriaticum]|uniref:Uncharacterized protein n=1 Tax=Symbiodinium microadriaticum TaxID=2951 RepID=A0A1Q9DVV7_SYMMI|nr:hypothetical protein AK812_SmicGene18157 [Symbiodinium microadriaticum]
MVVNDAECQEICQCFKFLFLLLGFVACGSIEGQGPTPQSTKVQTEGQDPKACAAASKYQSFSQVYDVQHPLVFGEGGDSSLSELSPSKPTQVMAPRSSTAALTIAAGAAGAASMALKKTAPSSTGAARKKKAASAPTRGATSSTAPIVGTAALATGAAVLAQLSTSRRQARVAMGSGLMEKKLRFDVVLG